MKSQYTAAISRRTQQARNCAFAIAAMAAYLSTPATAEPSYYGGVNFAILEHSTSGGSGIVDGTTVTTPSQNLDYTALIARLGVQFHENLSAEARFGFGVSDDSGTSTLTDGSSTSIFEYDVKLKSIYGGYLRAGAPVGELYPYLLAGWNKIEIELSAGSVSVDDGSWDFSYAVGTEFRISDEISANLEWGKYYDKGPAEISGALLGIVASF